MSQTVSRICPECGCTVLVWASRGLVVGTVLCTCCGAVWEVFA